MEEQDRFWIKERRGFLYSGVLFVDVWA